jgi:hypothetical protein
MPIEHLYKRSCIPKFYGFLWIRNPQCSFYLTNHWLPKRDIYDHCRTDGSFSPSWFIYFYFYPGVNYIKPWQEFCLWIPISPRETYVYGVSTEQTTSWTIDDWPNNTWWLIIDAGIAHTVLLLYIAIYSELHIYACVVYGVLQTGLTSLQAIQSDDSTMLGEYH